MRRDRRTGDRPAAQPTPGPWVCHSGCVYKDGPNVWPKGEETGIPIARMDREPGNGTLPTERDANARLIAAAPEMRRELRRGAALAQEVINNWESGDLAGAVNDLHDWIADAFDVLAKAEGRDQ